MVLPNILPEPKLLSNDPPEMTMSNDHWQHPRGCETAFKTHNTPHPFRLQEPFASYSPASNPTLGADVGYVNAPSHHKVGISGPSYHDRSEYSAQQFDITTDFGGFLDQEGVEVSPAFGPNARVVSGTSVDSNDGTVYETDLSGYFDAYTGTGTFDQFSGVGFENFAAEHPNTFDPFPAFSPIHHLGLPPPTLQSLPQPSGQGPLTCPHGCRGTFGRSVEYRRHMKKHGGLNLPCTQPGCTMSFYRRDKLHDHLRQRHGIARPRRAQAAAIIGASGVSTTGANQG